LIADHASNFIDKNKNNLGLQRSVVDSHIAYDLGIRELAIILSSQLNSHLIMGEYSRLIIDLNRDISDPTLISEISDKIIIKGNLELSKKEIRSRVRYYHKYHDLIKKKIADYHIKIIISLHSFNPVFKNKKRNIRYGVLSNSDKRLSNKILDQFKKNNILVGDNEPYKGNLIGDSLYRHALKNRLHHSLIEVRNDMLDSPKKIQKVSALLKKVLLSSIKHL
jgi:predicted N-formylglutamate amidohydrolase